MTIKEIIAGLKFTVEMFLFDPSTGETYSEPRNDMDKTTIDACKGAIEVLKQTQWTPVSEGPPEESGKYLVTFGGTNLTGSDNYTTELDARKLFEEPEEHIGWQSQNVVAWMPLPEPYRAESEEMAESLTNEETAKRVAETALDSFKYQGKTIREWMHIITSEDAISRAYIEPVIEELENIYVNGDEYILNLLADIKNAPSVTPQPKIGHWIKVTNGRGGHECDVCHNYAPSYQSGDEYLTKYCPNCGAKMQEAEEC